MKTLTTIGGLSLLLFICVSATPVKTRTGALQIKSATAGTSFDFFRTHRQGKGITSTWGLSSDAGVVGFYVKKTNEDPYDPYSYWEDVTSMPCNSSRSYKCTDNNVLPGFISYCVVAVMNDGTVVTSDISTVRIVSH